MLVACSSTFEHSGANEDPQVVTQRGLRHREVLCLLVEGQLLDRRCGGDRDQLNAQRVGQRL
jgi:hypothetical protein